NLGPVAARVTRASVRWSVDGSHWHAARLTRTDKNTFRVSYRDPAATTAHPYLSLEVSARDAAGRTISESVHHAYALPRGSSRARPAVATSAASARSRAARGRTLCGLPSKRHYTCFVRFSRGGRAPSRGSAAEPKGW